MLNFLLPKSGRVLQGDLVAAIETYLTYPSSQISAVGMQRPLREKIPFAGKMACKTRDIKS